MGWGALRAITFAVLCAAPLLVRGADAGAPEPEVPVPIAVSEAELDALAPGDARRGALLVQLAVRRHADATEAARQEQVTRALSLAQWREGEPAAPSREAPGSSPRADALRARVVAFALRALEEAPATPDLADALILGALDAERIGRSRDALRMLGALVRRHAGSAHVEDAWLALGEHHLRNADLTRARVAFDEAERHGRPAIRAWAASRNAQLRAEVTKR